MFLHNTIPHEHHGDISDEQHVRVHQEADSLFDWFGLMFHSDMGESHLEYFESVDYQDIQLAPMSIDTPLLSIVEDRAYGMASIAGIIVVPLSLSQVLSPSGHYTLCKSLRAPPVQG